MNDMRMAKYETLIEDIDSNIKKSVGLFGGLFGITRAVVAATGGSSSGNTALALIYDYKEKVLLRKWIIAIIKRKIWL